MAFTNVKVASFPMLPSDKRSEEAGRYEEQIWDLTNGGSDTSCVFQTGGDLVSNVAAHNKTSANAIRVEVSGGQVTITCTSGDSFRARVLVLHRNK